ncbi:hypothetical protein ACVGOW_32945 [Pseudonocardia saturnea]
MSNWVRGYGERRAAARESGAAPSGRHVLDEEAVLTPIFHALNRSGWRTRQQPERAPRAPRADEVDEFRRDPLTAPIPIQAFEAAATPSAALPAAAPRRRRSAVPDSRTSQSGAHALVEPHAGGRHHFRLEAAGAHR